MTPTKIKKSSAKTNSQIRINRTPIIDTLLARGRKKYKLLDDNEILKIYIGLGAEQDLHIDIDQINFDMSGQKSFLPAGDDEDFSQLYNQQKKKKINWDRL